MTGSKSKTFPSISAKMGDWTYFITTMTFADIAAWIKRPRQTSENEDFKNWLQRKMVEERLEKMAQYLLEQKQRFFNAIVVGVFGGDPEWYPVSITRSPSLGDIEIDERVRTSMGVLHLSGDEEAFSIDGQHRVEAIKLAIKQDSRVENDEQCVIFVAHKTDKLGHQRTRRLFTTLNKYARPVATGEIVALDEDDAFAIVTRRLIETYKPLKEGFVSFSKRQNLLQNDKKGITTTVALYQLVQTIALPRNSRERTKLKIGPPKEERIQEIYEINCEFWNALRKHVLEIKRVTDSKPEKELAGKYRGKGHVLFRPVGQQAFATAARIMIDRGVKLDDAVKTLSKTVLKLGSIPWPKVLWDPGHKTMITNRTTLAYNLFLYMAKQKPFPLSYNLTEEYKTVVGNELPSL